MEPQRRAPPVHSSSWHACREAAHGLARRAHQAGDDKDNDDIDGLNKVDVSQDL